MENFDTAGKIISLFKVLAVVGLAICAMAFVIILDEVAFGSAVLVVAPFLLALMFQYLICEIARAVFVIASASQSAATSLARSEFTPQKPASPQSAQVSPHIQETPHKSKEPSVVTPRAVRSGPSIEVLQVFKGHRIMSAPGGGVAVGSRTFLSMATAKAAIDAGEFD